MAKSSKSAKPASKVKVKGKPKTAKLSKQQSYETEVERYLDKAIKQIHDEIIPRIDIIDMRDKEQYDAAKKIILDFKAISTSRQEQVEKTVNRVKDELDEMYDDRKTTFAEFRQSFTSLHDKIDKHIEDESKEFGSIKQTLEENTKHTLAIQQTIDDVSANGNRGLSASFTDMYNKLLELQHVTQGARARARFWTVAHEIIENTALLKPLKYRWGAILYIAFILLLVNTILHAIGVQFDVISILTWVFTLGKRGG